eukprot:CAMPEP_0172438288 /NCGR_PEP_ID=MMETSP1064-20121228/72719_1 /TAXON_ID=202472 /ORGANISM="Aulacoseira subarctica , Strain CCAP 1002/5" /LENGTH=752 /DNA_ID=CAMNT_0013186835 /DNA_START=95 /DNA_END=2353 /DNA_ORIENTATION=+
MLDYSIEFLAGAGVEEIFVFCVHGADEVERYVFQSSWSNVLQVHCVKDATCATPGDALRELDKRGLVRSDPFVLMSGDVITNVDLRLALDAHAKRRKADSSAIMTMLLKPVGPPSSGGSSACVRPASEDLVVGLHPQTHRILMYDDRPHVATLKIPCDFFQACNSTIEIRNDLMPIGVDICSPEVLSRFSDEFDYRHIYKQFVHDTVAEEEEGLQSKIYAHLLANPCEYGARIVDFRTYHAISRDIIRRWCYPVGVDNLPSGYEKNYRYVMQRHFVYREVFGEPGTRIARSTQIVSDTIVGANVQIGERCIVQGTVIGNYCEIGNDVSLKDCHLWEKVCISDNVKIEGCVLCDGVVIRSGATLGTGCIIGKGCIIGENAVIPPFTRITLCVKDEEGNEYDDAFSSSKSSSSAEDNDDEIEENEDEEESDDEVLSMEDDFLVLCDKAFVSDHNVVGKDGLGRVWNPPAPEDESDYDSGEDGDAVIGDIRAQSIGYDAADFFKRRLELQSAQEALDDRDVFSDDEEEYDGTEEYSNGEVDISDNYTPGELPLGNNPNTGLDEDGFAIMGRQKGVDVVKELKMLCLEHDKGRDVTYLAIELNSFKFSQNATYSDCCTGAILAVLDLANLTTDKKIIEVIKHVEIELKYWSPLFKKLCQGIEEERAIINAIESVAVGSIGELAQVLSKEPTFRFVLQKLHDLEFLSEEAILSWAAERRRNEEDDSSDPVVKLFLQQATQEFLDWLEEETSSSEEDD